MNRYEDPTQRLHSHNWSEEYKENYDAIFGKKETWLERRERERKMLEELPTPAEHSRMLDEQCCGKCSPCSGHDKEDKDDCSN